MANIFYFCRDALSLGRAAVEALKVSVRRGYRTPIAANVETMATPWAQGATSAQIEFNLQDSDQLFCPGGIELQCLTLLPRVSAIVRAPRIHLQKHP